MFYYTDSALLPAFDKIIQDAEQKIKELTNMDFKLTIDLPKNEGHPFSLEMMILLCEMFNVKWSDVLKDDRSFPLPFVRQLFSYFTKNYTDYGLKDISRILNCDHTTVIYSIQRIKGFLEVKDPKTMKAVEAIISKIQAPLKEKTDEPKA